jgi:hypothetical protein
MATKALIRLTIMMMIGMVSFPKRLRADVGRTILGAVTDPGGAAIPRAKVTRNNPKTGLLRTITIGANGNSESLTVQVGTRHMLQVQASGLKTLSIFDITLFVNQKLAANFRLSGGGVSQKVNISADATQVESTSNRISSRILQRFQPCPV